MMINFKMFKSLGRKHTQACPADDLYSRALTAKDASLSPEFAYFLINSSFGDKWLIISFLPEMIRLQANVRVLASRCDYELLRIFLGNKKIEEHVIFLDEEIIYRLSSFITPISPSTSQFWIDRSKLIQTPSVLENGIPVNTIRHLHVVKYPYFSDLHLFHGVPYSTLLKMIMYLPHDTTAHRPAFYECSDQNDMAEIIQTKDGIEKKRLILFNIVNVSHLGLDENQIRLVVEQFAENGFDVLVNVTQHKDKKSIANLLSHIKRSRLIEIPGHLVALVSDNVTGVIGILGGAMCIATYFSRTNTLSLTSNAMYFDLSLCPIYDGRYGEKVWDFESKTWPYVDEKHYHGNVDIGDPADLSSDALIKIITMFVNELNKR